MYPDSINEAATDDSKAFSDQLLVLLCDNQIFISKVQRAQWNYEILPLEAYNMIVNLLFNCAELISEQLKYYNGHVPAGLAVYLEVSNLKEELEVGSEFEIKKEVIQSHNVLLDYLMQFMNDETHTFYEVRKELTTELHQSHTEVYQLLEILNK